MDRFPFLQVIDFDVILNDVCEPGGETGRTLETTTAAQEQACRVELRLGWG